MTNRIEESHPYLEHHVVFTEEEAESLRRLCEKTDLRSRGQCLAWIEEGTPTLSAHEDIAARNADVVLPPLETLAHDRRRRVRESAIRKMRCILDACPGEVWQTMTRLAGRRDAALADMALSILIPDFLYDRFDEYFPKVCAAIEAGNRPVLDALERQWRSGWVTDHADEIGAWLVVHGVAPKSAADASDAAAWDKARRGLRQQQRDRLRDRPRRRNRVETSHPHFLRGPLRLSAGEWASLGRLAESTDVPSRGHCLAWIDLAVKGYPEFILDGASADSAITLLEALAVDERKPVRVAAFFLLNDIVGPWPQKTWPVALRLMHHPSPDVACWVPVGILEDLLAFRCDDYYPMVRDAIEAGDRRMAEAVNGCMILNGAEKHRDEIVALLQRHGIESRYGRGLESDEAGERARG